MSRPHEKARAHEIWRAGRRPDPQHTYLKAHRIGSSILRQTRHGELIFPLCVRGELEAVRLIPWGVTQLPPMFGHEPRGCYVPTGAVKPGKPLVVVADWPSAATLEKRGMTAWATLDSTTLGLVALQARSAISPDGHLLIAGDNTEEGAHRANCAALSRQAELILPGRPMGAPQWVATFNDVARWDAGERRAWV